MIAPSVARFSIPGAVIFEGTAHAPREISASDRGTVSAQERTNGGSANAAISE